MTAAPASILTQPRKTPEPPARPLLDHSWIPHPETLCETVNAHSSFFFLFMAAPATYGNSQAGVKLEQQPPAYATASAIQEPSHIRDLCHSLQQCHNLNPLIATRDRTRILRETTSGPQPTDSQQELQTLILN